MKEISKLIRFNDTLIKNRTLNFINDSTGFDTTTKTEYISITSSNSATFYFIRTLLSERFYEDSFTSLTALTYIAIPKRYLGLGLSSAPFAINAYTDYFNLSSDVNNYFWSSTNQKNPSDYRIAVVEDANAVNTPNANMIKNSFGYSNMDFGKTGSTISITSQNYDIIISDRTFSGVTSGTTLSTLYNMGYKILSTGNDSNAVASSILTLITSNTSNGNTRWSSSANPAFVNSLLTSGVTGWSSDGGDTGNIITVLKAGTSAVYYHSTTGTGTYPTVIVAENSAGGKWVHFQDGYIYSHGSGSAVLRNAMQYLTQNTQKNYVMSDIGLIVLPNTQYKTNSSLIGEWKFNELSGTTAYDTGYFSSISANNFVLTNASFTGGYGGNGLYFNESLSGTGVRTSPNNLLKLNTSAFTVSFLYKPTASGTNQYLIEGYVGRPIIGMGSTNRLYIIVRDPGNTYYATYTSTATFNFNEWNWMGVVWNPSISSVSFFKNGTFADSFSTSGIIGGSDASEWRIGGRNNLISGGIYDNIRIYNQSFTTQEMTNLYNFDVRTSGNDFGITGVTMTPYNELELYATIQPTEFNFTTNPTAFENKTSTGNYLSVVADKSFGTLMSKVLYLDENLNVLATGTPSVPIKIHDKLPTTIVTKIIL